MKLLILGAGGHGQAVKEVAETLGIYRKIAFLDDRYKEKDAAESDIIGKLSDYEKHKDEFPHAFAAIGNPELRKDLLEKLQDAGYKVVSLISSHAVVAPSAEIAEGCVVMPGAVIQSNAKIGRGGIVSAGAIIDHDSKIGAYSHVNAGAIVPSMSEVREKTKINYGEVWRNV